MPVVAGIFCEIMQTGKLRLSGQSWFLSTEMSHSSAVGTPNSCIKFPWPHSPFPLVFKKHICFPLCQPSDQGICSQCYLEDEVYQSSQRQKTGIYGILDKIPASRVWKGSFASFVQMLTWTVDPFVQRGAGMWLFFLPETLNSMCDVGFPQRCFFVEMCALGLLPLLKFIVKKPSKFCSLHKSFKLVKFP